MTANVDRAELPSSGVDRDRLVELVAWLLSPTRELGRALAAPREYLPLIPAARSMELGQRLGSSPVLASARAVFEQDSDLWSRRRGRGLVPVGASGGSAAASYGLWEAATPVATPTGASVAVLAIIVGLGAVVFAFIAVGMLCAPPRWRRELAWQRVVGDAALLARTSGKTVRQRQEWRERKGSLIERVGVLPKLDAGGSR